MENSRALAHNLGRRWTIWLLLGTIWLLPNLLAQQTSSTDMTMIGGVKAQVVTVVGQVYAVGFPAKNCVGSKTCWGNLTVEEGGNTEWTLWTQLTLPLKKDQYIRARIARTPDGERFMSKAEIAAHLPRLLDYKVVTPETDQDAKYAAIRLQADHEAFAQMQATPQKEFVPLDRYLAKLVSTKGHHFKVPQRTSVSLMDEMISHIPDSDFVNRKSMYPTVLGLDDTSTAEALQKVRSRFIGKYYVLQGDRFSIRADRDYPKEGLNTFYEFASIDIGDHKVMGLNVECFSAQKIPPYSIAPVLGRIVDFKLGQDRSGKNIIVTVLRVIALVRPSECCGIPEDVYIN